MSDIVKLPKNYLSLVLGSTNIGLHYSALLVCLLTLCHNYISRES